MNNHTEQESSPSEPVNVTGALQQIGSQLQALRDEKKLGLEEVAERLRLSPDVLSAIEAGDVDSLPSMTFVRGYIRSYARFLQADEAVLLAPLGESGNQYTRPLSVKKPLPYQTTISMPSGKWFARVLGLSAVAGLVVFSYPAVERMLSPKQQQAEAPQLKLPRVAGQLDKVPAVEKKQVVEPQMQEVVMIDAAGQLEKTTASAVVNKAARVDSDQQAAAPEKVVQPVELSLYSKADSWVEVSAEGRKYLAGIMHAGSSEIIRARPPFDILIGNAPAIELKYNDVPFDTTPFSRGKVARFTLNN